MKSYKMSRNVENQSMNYPTHQYIKIRNTIVLFTFLLQFISIILTFITNLLPLVTLTINIPVNVVVVVVVIVVIERCRFQQFFFSIIQ